MLATQPTTMEMVLPVYCATELDFTATSACFAAVHEGAHTTWARPMSLRVVMVDLARCVPQRKQDIVPVMLLVGTLNGDPLTLAR